ncbi:hypothetical protein AS030_10680 [Fictibacillus enclensis]|uniref:Uncharacterized protein n=1 Tax=Fictibacillus enclensis TaxID=1017270 RepID=A0A0V8J892_9BACL|nr:hypothetical protein AS030_10680 [Fictibacillus enclensis]
MLLVYISGFEEVETFLKKKVIKDFYAYLIPRYFIFFYDLEKYRDTLRGFYINLEEEVPGPLLRDSEDVIRTIENIDEVMEQYKGNYECFYEKFCGWEKGNATKQVVEHVFKS